MTGVQTCALPILEKHARFRCVRQRVRFAFYTQQEYLTTFFFTCKFLISHSRRRRKQQSIDVHVAQTFNGPELFMKLLRSPQFVFCERSMRALSYVHEANFNVQFCSSKSTEKRRFSLVEQSHMRLPNGKNRTSMEHELRNIPVDNQVIVPSDETITLVEI